MRDNEALKPSSPLFSGIVTAGVGGLYTVRCENNGGEIPAGTIPDGTIVRCRAKGTFRHDGLSPLVGDRVRISVPEGYNCEDAEESSENASRSDSGARIEEILPRRNALLRPAMANLDTLFFVIAAKDPDPSLRFIDKLLVILEYEKIEPVIIVSKCDLDREKAEKLRIKYEKCGYTVILTDSETRSGDAAVADYLKTLPAGSVSAFSGVSGAGKSTLMNRLFPELSLETGELSEKIARGKHTTRAVELYRLSDCAGDDAYHGDLADTPGFSMLDFARFDFFSCEELPGTFREFVPYLGKCRYTKCTHTKEDGCAILAAVSEKKIPKSRHTSYMELFDVLKVKKDWEK